MLRYNTEGSGVTELWSGANRLRPLAWVSASLFSLAVAANAQDTAAPARHLIHGVVFDSVAGAPLVGARVELAAREGSSAPLSIGTDSTGAYRFAGLPAGQYVIGFYHDRLTEFGLDAPTRALDLGADSAVTVNLAVPSSQTLRLLRCGTSPYESASGMLLGSVRDALTQATIPGAALRLSWRALAFDAGAYRTVSEQAEATIEPDGTFLACRVPTDVVLEAAVTAPGYRTVEGPVALVPVSGIGRLAVWLTDSSVVSGPAAIVGRVTLASGKVVSSGRAGITALQRDVPIVNGSFVIRDVPPGSWVVETRVMGREPQARMVTVSDSAREVLAVQVGEPLQRLEVVTVVGERDANTRLLEDILRRKRIGMGTVFLPGSPALKSAMFTSDVMKEARGFQYQGRDRITARVSLSTRGGGRCRSIAVYVDDMLQPYGFEGLDAVAPPSTILAIETFPDILLAPVQYRTAKTVLTSYGAGTAGTYCAAVLVWTKRFPSG